MADLERDPLFILRQQPVRRTMSADLVAEAVREYWGERCTDFDNDCACCQAWAQFAALEAEASVGERRGLERALEFAKYEAAAWGYEQGSSARVAAAKIERALALIPEAPVREGWLPISTAPKDWSDVLLFVPDLQSDHRTVCEGFYDAEEKIWRSPAFWEVVPTHWRPLPAPPQDNREG